MQDCQNEHSMYGQVCGGYVDTMTRCAKLLSDQAEVDFVDINCGCPIDLICNKCAPLCAAAAAGSGPNERALTFLLYPTCSPMLERRVS